MLFPLACTSFLKASAGKPPVEALLKSLVSPVVGKRCWWFCCAQFLGRVGCVPCCPALPARGPMSLGPSVGRGLASLATHTFLTQLPLPGRGFKSCIDFSEILLKFLKCSCASFLVHTFVKISRGRESSAIKCLHLCSARRCLRGPFCSVRSWWSGRWGFPGLVIVIPFILQL